jgi:hypothetical protein
MAEKIEGCYELTLDKISKTRENLNLQPLDSIKAGSQDWKLRRETLDKVDFEDSDFFSPEKENIKRVDIIEQLSQYSEKEIELILKNLASLQLTEGCNGRCPFCFLARKGERRGVTARYSFSSLKKFENKYASKLISSFVLYAESDPFDYYDKDEDGNEYTFLDVYKLFPSQAHALSTAIPKGSEEMFIAYVEGIIKNILAYASDVNEVETNDYQGPRIRLSVGRHNIRRIEKTLTQLGGRLKNLGCSEEEIDQVFQYCIRIETRLDAQFLGLLIEQHDDIRDASSFACVDGVTITPDSCCTRLAVTPTIYEPSGEMILPIIPGKGERTIINYKYLSDFDDDAVQSSNRHNPFLSLPRLVDGSILEIEDEKENLIFLLSRASTSLAKFVISLAKCDESFFDDRWREHSSKNINYFLEKAKQVFKKMGGRVRKTIKQAEKMESNSTESDERLNFYLLLCKTYLTQVDFLIRKHKRQSAETICSMAQVLRSVGRDNVSDLAETIKNLQVK